jgi:hypothetical protein
MTDEEIDEAADKAYESILRLLVDPVIESLEDDGNLDWAALAQEHGSVNARTRLSKTSVGLVRELIVQHLWNRGYVAQALEIERRPAEILEEED